MQQQLPPQRRTGSRQECGEALIALQQRKRLLACHHSGISISRQQEIHAITLIERQGLSMQPPQLRWQARVGQSGGIGSNTLELTLSQLNQHSGTGRQHQPSTQTGIQQQIPAFFPSGEQIGTVPQQHNPGAKSPRECQGR